MLRKGHILVILLVIASVTTSLIFVEANAQTIVTGNLPPGIVHGQDERIYIVQHKGFSHFEGVEGQYATDSIIYGDIINISDETVYYIIMRGNVYEEGTLLEKTGYGQKWTFRHNYSPQFGNPTELAISPFKMTLRPGEASPFALWPGQTGWDCYEVWIEGYELENSAEGITDKILRNDVVFSSGELDNKGNYKGKVLNPTENSIKNAYVVVVKYDSNNEIFAIVGDELSTLSPGNANSFTVSVFLQGFPIKTHTDNFLYGKPDHIEVLAWGYTEDRTQIKTASGYAGDLILRAESQYYPNEPRPLYMNLEEIKEKAKQDANKPINSDFCLNPEKKEIVMSTSISVPSWIKQNAGWWSEGQIDDNSFLTGIEYLIKQKVIKLDMPEPDPDEQRYQSGIPERTTGEIPSWIKNNAQWWSENKISTEDFVAGLKYLIENEIIRT